MPHGACPTVGSTDPHPQPKSGRVAQVHLSGCQGSREAAPGGAVCTHSSSLGFVSCRGES